VNTFLDKFLRWMRFKKLARHIPRDSVVCDLGCGKDVYLLKRLEETIKLGVGIDRDVRESSGPRIRTKKIGISNKIPLENESCDIVLMAAFLEHLNNHQEVLKESFRILKKNGRLIITTPTPLSKTVLETLAALRLVDKETIKDHKNYFYPKDVKKMLLSAGFNKDGIKSRFFEFFLNSLIIAEKSREVPINYAPRTFKTGKKIRWWRDGFKSFYAIIKYRIVN